MLFWGKAKSESIFEDNENDEEIRKPVRKLVTKDSNLSLSKASITNIKKKFYVINIETTGLDKEDDEIIEVAAILYENGTIIKEFESLVWAGTPISKEAFKQNNIDQAVVNKAPLPKKVYPQLVNFLNEAITGNVPVLIYNPNFTLEFLLRAAKKYKFSFDISYLDVGAFAKKVLKPESIRQPDISKQLELSYEKHRRALADAKNCGEIFFKLVEISEL